MNLNEGGSHNDAAWWAVGIVGLGVSLWKAFFHMRRDQRDDHEGKGRADLIERLQTEIHRQSDLIRELTSANENLTDSLDEEIAKRRTVEERAFFALQRIQVLEHKIRDLGGLA